MLWKVDSDDIRSLLKTYTPINSGTFTMDNIEYKLELEETHSRYKSATSPLSVGIFLTPFAPPTLGITIRIRYSVLKADGESAAIPPTDCYFSWNLPAGNQVALSPTFFVADAAFLKSCFGQRREHFNCYISRSDRAND